jgi:hypothetical protein
MLRGVVSVVSCPKLALPSRFLGIVKNGFPIKTKNVLRNADLADFTDKSRFFLHFSSK